MLPIYLLETTNVPETKPCPAAEDPDAGGSFSKILAAGTLKQTQIEHSSMETGSIMRIPIPIIQEIPSNQKAKNSTLIMNFWISKSHSFP